MFPDSRTVAGWMVVFAGAALAVKLGGVYPPPEPWIYGGLGAALAVGVVLAVRSARRTARELGDYDAELRQVCPACGYDMRATPQRCPECGREPKLTDASPPPGLFDHQPRLPRRRHRH